MCLRERQMKWDTRAVCSIWNKQVCASWSVPGIFLLLVLSLFFNITIIITTRKLAQCVCCISELCVLVHMTDRGLLCMGCVVNESVYFMLCYLWQIRQISAQKEVQEDLVQRYTTINDRLNSLRVENDEVSISWSSSVVAVVIQNWYWGRVMGGSVCALLF